MPVELKLDAEVRVEHGRGASRRLRHAKKVPAVLYGGRKDPVSLQLGAQQLSRLLEEEAFYSQILTLVIAGKKQQVVVKDMQRHPVKPIVLHLDLQRVVANELMTAHVPLHFLGKEEAIKKFAGVIHQDIIELQIECMPKNLPKNIEVDCSGLDIGAVIHLSDLKLPAGVTIPVLAQGAEFDRPVVSMVASRVVVEEAAAGETAAAEEEAK